jgi:hypothetical protein
MIFRVEVERVMAFVEARMKKILVGEQVDDWIEIVGQCFDEKWRDELKVGYLVCSLLMDAAWLDPPRMKRSPDASVSLSERWRRKWRWLSMQCYRPPNSVNKTALPNRSCVIQKVVCKDYRQLGTIVSLGDGHQSSAASRTAFHLQGLYNRMPSYPCRISSEG